MCILLPPHYICSSVFLVLSTVLTLPLYNHILALVVSTNQFSPSLYSFHLYNFHFITIISGVHKSQATKLCTLVPNICGCLVQQLLHVTFLAPTTVRCLLYFCKIFTHLYYLIMAFSFSVLFPSFKGNTRVSQMKNLKFVINNRNFGPLSCKLVSVLQRACRMACRWQHSADARTPSQYQYKDGCPT